MGRNSYGGRGRGRDNSANAKVNDNQKTLLHPPNRSNETLSNYPYWKDQIYQKAKDATKYWYKIINQSVEPTIMNSLDPHVIIEYYPALSEREKEEAATSVMFDEQQIAEIQSIEQPNKAELESMKKSWREIKSETYKEMYSDKPILYNILWSNLSLTSKELIESALGDEYERIRDNSEVKKLWNAIKSTHSGGAE